MQEFIVSNLEDENDGDFSSGDLSLREAITLANEKVGTDKITFDASLSGSAIALDTSESSSLVIKDSVDIIGLAQDNLTLDGGFVVNIAENIDVEITNLNIDGGKIDSSGNFSLSNSTIY